MRARWMGLFRRIERNVPAERGVLLLKAYVQECGTVNR
jgi:hypothetical protein